MDSQEDDNSFPARLYRYRNLGRTFEFVQREAEAVRLQYVWASDYLELNDAMEGLYIPNFSQSPYQELTLNILSEEKARIGISCFSETNYNELMWAHYAGNYTGICIEYSVIAIKKGLSVARRMVRVVYGDEPPQVNGRQLRGYAEAAIMILSHKKSSWAYEREWRLVESLGKIVFSTQPVRAIYFGSRTPARVRSDFIAQLQGQKLKFFNMTVSGYKHEWTKTSKQIEIAARVKARHDDSGPPA